MRPGVPLGEQAAQDLMWIREDFLGDTRDHGAVIVHGPHRDADDDAGGLAQPQSRIDTGAVLGGPLTCVVIEGLRWGFCSVAGGSLRLSSFGEAAGLDRRTRVRLTQWERLLMLVLRSALRGAEG